MRQKKASNRETCPVAKALEVIGDRWSLLIIRNAFDGMSRFGEFQKDLNLSRSVLAERLRRLVSSGILRLIPGEDGSAYQQYELTEKGRGLFHTIVGLRQWGEEFLFGATETHSVLIERSSRKEVPPMELRSRAGRVLQPDDVTVVKVVQR